MRLFFLILYNALPLLVMSQSSEIFKFSKTTEIKSWLVVNDGVMGGISKSTIQINNEGHGFFSGTVKLENNGGFASVRHTVKETNLNLGDKFVIKIKGDGKVYQFRCKSKLYDRQSYVYEFKTTGDWQILEILFLEMTPRFRGYNLDMPNYPGDSLAEVAFLIGNKVKESFTLEIDYVKVQ